MKSSADANNKQTLLESYIKSSPQCAELFRIWSALGAEERHAPISIFLVSAVALILENNVAGHTKGI